MSECALLRDLSGPLRRYAITVTVPRDGDSDDALLPPFGYAALQLAAAVIAAEGLVSAWTCGKTAVSMLVDGARKSDALHARAAVASVLNGGAGTVTVAAEPMPYQASAAGLKAVLASSQNRRPKGSLVP